MSLFEKRKERSEFKWFYKKMRRNEVKKKQVKIVCKGNRTHFKKNLEKKERKKLNKKSRGKI